MNGVDSLRNYSCGGGVAQYGGDPLPAAAPWLLILPDLHILRVHILPRRHRQHLGALGLEGQTAGGRFGRADPDVSDDCCSTPVFYLRPRSVKVPWGRFTKEGAWPTSHCSNISVMLYCCKSVMQYGFFYRIHCNAVMKYFITESWPPQFQATNNGDFLTN